MNKSSGIHFLDGCFKQLLYTLTFIPVLRYFTKGFWTDYSDGPSAAQSFVDRYIFMHIIIVHSKVFDFVIGSFRYGTFAMVYLK